MNQDLPTEARYINNQYFLVYNVDPTYTVGKVKLGRKARLQAFANSTKRVVEVTKEVASHWYRIAKAADVLVNVGEGVVACNWV